MRVYPANSVGGIAQRTPLTVAMTSTDVNGAFNVPVAGLVAGTYDVNVKPAHALSVEQRGVRLPAGWIALDTAREGDPDGDDVIMILDFSVLASSFNRKQGQAGFRTEADFDQDGALHPPGLLTAGRQLLQGRASSGAVAHGGDDSPREG